MSLLTNVEDKRLYSSNVDTTTNAHEQLALEELKQLVGYVPLSTSDAAVDVFLLRYLSAVKFSPREAVTLLQQRRSFEVSLTSLRITTPVLDTLRSGVISVMGKDLLNRPILYIRTQRIPLSTLNAEDLQRLVTMLMEYMLSYCIYPSELLTKESKNGSTSHMEKKKRHLHKEQQRIILLVNEEMSSWHANQSILSNLSTLCNIITKYYPQLIDLILLFEAPWDVRREMKTMFKEIQTDTEHIVQMVTRGNIQKYVDRRVLLRELGGINTVVECPDSFADAVLRHWYLKTSYMSLEETQKRPLWKLPPLFMNSSDWDILRRRKITPLSTSGVSSTGSSPPLAPHSVAFYVGSVGNLSSRTSHRSHTYRTCSEDEGFCSIISESEELYQTFSSAKPRSQEVYIDGHTTPPLAELVQELQKERELRIAAEQQLKKYRLGVTLDLATATELERVLACMHTELNVLIGNILVRARAAAANGSPPTLSQLLDLTLSAVESAAHKTQRVPAMKFAVPLEQNETSSTCCCCM